MSKIENDKYYTDNAIAKHCVETTFSILGNEWDRIIEPSVGDGAFLHYLPDSTICYDIAPSEKVPQTIQQDFRETKLPYLSNSLVISNPPFGRANKLSVQFVKHSMELGDYAAFIQPISQLNQNRTMKDTELLYSEDLGTSLYSGRKVHCCFNIYHKCKDGHKQDYSIPGVVECRHIFRSGKYKHNDNVINDNWDYRIAAWGNIRLLQENEYCPNEVVLKVLPEKKEWLRHKLEQCNYKQLISCVSSPNLPAWRLKKWLKEEYDKENNV